MNSSYQPIEYPVVRIYQNSLVIWNQKESLGRRSDRSKKNESNLTRGKFKGFISPKSKSKIKKILSTWLNGGLEIRKEKSKKWLPKIPYFTFVTLTLSSPQLHWDQTIRRKILTPFIQELIRTKNVWHYYYVSEAQANGNIHFHLLIDSYIPWEDLRDLWNHHQNSLGYIDRFENVFNHNNPNSTDIHSLEKIDSVESYVMKYISKTEGRRKIQGKVWGCSDGLKKLKPKEELIEGEYRTMVDEVLSYDEFRIHQDEKITVAIGDIKRFLKIRYPKIHASLINHWSSQVSSIYKIHPSIIEASEKIRKLENQKTLKSEQLYKTNLAVQQLNQTQSWNPLRQQSSPLFDL